jgi:hypothetical protein
MNGELVCVSRLKIRRSSETRDYELRAVISVILPGKTLDEKENFRTRVRVRDLAQRKVRIGLDGYEVTAIHETLNLRGFFRESEILFYGDLVLLLHRAWRPAKGSRIGWKWNYNRKRKERSG